jgi:broad specificity phosphatase PhoE
MPPPPNRIYLVRHGQSEASLDKTVNARLPDHRVELSPAGHRQAAAARPKLRPANGPALTARAFCDEVLKVFTV